MTWFSLSVVLAARWSRNDHAGNRRLLLSRSRQKVASLTRQKQRPHWNQLMTTAGQSPELRAQLGEITDDEAPPPSRHEPALPQRRQRGGHGSPRQPHSSGEFLLGETKVRLLAARN